MSKKGEKAIDRIQRLKNENRVGPGKELVGQLTHEATVGENFEELAQKLKERQRAERDPALSDPNKYVKYTIYVEKPVAEAFQALCLKRGDQRKHANQAIKEFVEKKARELGL